MSGVTANEQEEERTTAELIMTLGDDVDRCHGYLGAVLEAVQEHPTEKAYDDFQFYARQLIRAVFAYIEAVTFSVKLKAAIYCQKLNRGLRGRLEIRFFVFVSVA